MRRAAKVDANQPEVVEGLRKIPGVSVEVLSRVGEGVPDILVGYAGFNFLFEIKNPDVPKSDQKLTPDQAEWHGKWKGHVDVVKSAVEAWDIIVRRSWGNRK